MKISRRDFLKGSAAGALGLAATSILGPATALADDAKTAEAPVNVYKVMTELNPQDYDFRDPDSDLSAVFSPWKFGGLTLNHRMVKSAAGSDTQKGSEEEAVAALALAVDRAIHEEVHDEESGVITIRSAASAWNTPAYNFRTIKRH